MDTTDMDDESGAIGQMDVSPLDEVDPYGATGFSLAAVGVEEIEARKGDESDLVQELIAELQKLRERDLVGRNLSQAAMLMLYLKGQDERTRELVLKSVILNGWKIDTPEFSIPLLMGDLVSLADRIPAALDRSAIKTLHLFDQRCDRLAELPEQMDQALSGAVDAAVSSHALIMEVAERYEKALRQSVREGLEESSMLAVMELDKKLQESLARIEAAGKEIEAKQTRAQTSCEALLAHLGGAAEERMAKAAHAIAAEASRIVAAELAKSKGRESWQWFVYGAIGAVAGLALCLVIKHLA